MWCHAFACWWETRPLVRASSCETEPRGGGAVGVHCWRDLAGDRGVLPLGKWPTSSATPLAGAPLMGAVGCAALASRARGGWASLSPALVQHAAFCVACVPPLTGRGFARPGATMREGAVLEVTVGRGSCVVGSSTVFRVRARVARACVFHSSVRLVVMVVGHSLRRRPPSAECGVLREKGADLAEASFEPPRAICGALRICVGLGPVRPWLSEPPVAAACPPRTVTRVTR